MFKPRLQPIDRLALSLISLLTLAIGGLVAVGKACGPECVVYSGPRVQNLSWQGQQIGSQERAFILTFDRPMDRQSVEANLVIDPPLPGKISWAGRGLAYTVDAPVPYGETYQVQLEGAKGQFRGGSPGEVMRPYVGEFRSRDRAFAYIGVQGEERGRLVFYNLTQKRKAILTPPNLTVTDFKFYPQGERLLFSAAEKNRGGDGLRELRLYTVKAGSEGKTPAKVELVLDSEAYENHQFDLSADGETIVVQRIKRDNPADFDLWAVKPGATPKPLKVQGGEFRMAPDGQTLAVTRGEGIGILPLQPDAQPLDYLPKFGQLLSFSADGTAAVTVDFNTDDPKLRYTRSLFYVNNQGVQRKLLDLQGSILDCQFNPQGSELYCLLAQLLPGEEYQEQSYLAKIEVKSGKVTPLAALTEFQDTQMSLAPDGLALLFDQVTTSDNPYGTDILRDKAGEVIVDGRLWLLLPPAAKASGASQPQVEAMPLVGFHPQWMP